MSLSYPMDSYLEYRLSICEIYQVMMEEQVLGYFGLLEESLHFFHVLLEHHEIAPMAFCEILSSFKPKSVYVMTQDSLFLAVLSEWDYEKKNESCLFIDSNKRYLITKDIEGLTIHLAQLKDRERILEGTGAFYDSLEQRITEQTIFLFEQGDQLLGCGHIERSLYCKDYVSVGMITCAEHRRKGIGQKIILYLKDWAYLNGIKPIAGCSYSNRLSRKTLEKAGMVVIGIGYEAILLSKNEETSSLQSDLV